MRMRYGRLQEMVLVELLSFSRPAHLGKGLHFATTGDYVAA
jgi:hypothetical protein